MCVAGVLAQFDQRHAPFQSETLATAHALQLRQLKMNDLFFCLSLVVSDWHNVEHTQRMTRTRPVQSHFRTLLIMYFKASVIATILVVPYHADANENVKKWGERSSAATIHELHAITFDQFLDRLMLAESGGRAFAKNPLSTALGPFQFIASTWLQIARKTFSADILTLKPHEILALRTVPSLARQAAKSYTEDNAAYLVAKGHPATFTNLRLAFLAGPNGATRILSAKPETSVGKILGPLVIRANPFMTRMSARDLIARAARDISTDPASTAGLSPDDAAIAAVKARGVNKSAEARSHISVACDLTLPKCKRWLALATRRATRAKRVSRK